jgi:thiamine-monophosphate kinase
MNRDPQILAATGGEDYELLLAASEGVVESLAAGSEAPVTVIGEVMGESVVFVRDGEPMENLSGWDHFAGP